MPKNLKKTQYHKGEKYESIPPPKIVTVNVLFMLLHAGILLASVYPAGIVLGVWDTSSVSKTSLYLCRGLPEGLLFPPWDACTGVLVTDTPLKGGQTDIELEPVTLPQ